MSLLEFVISFKFIFWYTFMKILDLYGKKHIFWFKNFANIYKSQFEPHPILKI